MKKESSSTPNNSNSNRDKKSDWDNRTIVKSTNREEEPPRRKDKTSNEKSYSNYNMVCILLCYLLQENNSFSKIGSILQDDQKYIVCLSPTQNQAAEEMSSLSSTNSNGSHRNAPDLSERGKIF